MAEVDEQVTLDPVDVEVGNEPSGESATTEDPATPADFLRVNERTVYKTQDDAIRGYSEAANRIAQLSGWEKEAQQYGLTDSRQFKAVAEELLSLRQQLADYKKQAGMPKAQQADSADPKAKEAAQVREYLRSQGFISKEEQTEALAELRDQIAEMRHSGQQYTEQRFSNQESDARDTVAGYLSSDGIKDDAVGTKLAVVGTLVKDWINGSDERVERWSKGGSSAKALVKEGYDFATAAIGWQKTAPAAAPGSALKPTDPGYAARKVSQAAASRKLPAQGTARGKETAGKPPKQRGHINAALHEKAWEMLNSGTD